MGTFSSLQTAASGMAAAKLALEVVANNIANANTPGYKRQRLVLLEGNPPNSSGMLALASEQTGTGVQVAGIRTIQNQFLDGRISAANQSKSRWSTTRDALQSVESVFAEPGENGLATLLDRFWNSWRELAASPDGLAARNNVVNEAQTLTRRLNELHSTLTSMRDQCAVGLNNSVERINVIASSIAEVNEKIVALEVGGAAPNDLLNRRDTLVQELATLVDVQTHGQTGAEFIVTVGGVTLVQGTMTREMSMQPDETGSQVPTWTDGPGPVAILSGQIKGTLEVRDEFLPDYIARLDAVATTLASEVNTLHQAGFGMYGTTGQPLFDITTCAGDIRLTDAVIADSALVATSSNGRASNAEVAQSIADLSQAALIGGETISQSYRTLISKLGGEVSLAERTASTRDFTLQQLENQRDSISGVSLDDEMLDMVRFQQSFAASARVFEATNYILETLLSSI